METNEDDIKAALDALEQDDAALKQRVIAECWRRMDERIMDAYREAAALETIH